MPLSDGTVLFRQHWATDRGQFASHMQQDLFLRGETTLGPKRAGILPYVERAGGIGSCLLGYYVFCWV